MDRVALERWVREHTAFSFARSGGAGGQNVNKLNTKVVATLALADLPAMSVAEAERIRGRLRARTNRVGELVVIVQETREQAQNRRIAERKIIELILTAARLIRRRIKTAPRPAARERRLAAKRHQAEKKAGRRVERGE